MELTEFKKRTDSMFDYMIKHYSSWKGIKSIPVIVFLKTGEKVKYLVESEAARQGHTPSKMLDLLKYNIGRDNRVYGVAYVIEAAMGIVPAGSMDEARELMKQLESGNTDINARHRQVLIMYRETRDGCVDGKIYAVVKDNDNVKLEEMPQLASVSTDALFKRFPLKTFNKAKRRRKTQDEDG